MKDILDHAGMADCKPCSTPVDTNPKLAADGPPVQDLVQEHVDVGDVRVMHVPTSSQYADIFTKGLLSSVFTEFMSSLNVRAADDQTAGAC